jgi:hypothetical protein
MKKDLIYVLIALFCVIAFRLYKFYSKKHDEKKNGVKKPGSAFISFSKDDDYEPYSKK